MLSNIMCTNPRIIYTNARYLSGVTKYQFSVPCGKCEECKIRIRNEYLVRAYYESLFIAKNHGVSVFQTLTYNDENVPTLYGIKCFRYFDLVNFRKRLRINLVRAGYDSSKMSYFIASEYGDKFGRPHYHIILNAWFKGATAHLLHEHINKAWNFGFCDKQIKQICLNSAGVGALSYVTKYVSKSLGDTQALEIAIKQGIKNLSDDEVKDIFENYSDCFKIKHFQSIGYGEYLLELLDQNAVINGIDLNKEFFENSRVYMPDKKNIYKFYPVGHYYIYKVMYDRVYNDVTGKRDTYVLNDIGKFWKYKRYIDSRDKFISRFNENKHNILKYINTFLNDANLSDSDNYLNTLKCSLVNEKFDVKGFAEYVLFYRNLSWIGSQYKPYEMFSFELDVYNDLNSHGYIENRCYEKKFVDSDTGEIITKPYSRQFREQLSSRSFDVVAHLDKDNDFESMLYFYNLMDNEDKIKRDEKNMIKSLATDQIHLVRLTNEIIVT